MGDSFSWTAGGSGSWDIAGNWLDLTTLATAEAAPGATDTATIDGPDTGAAITVGGPASVAGLTVNFAVDLAGDLAVDELTMAQPPSSFTPGTTTSDVTLSGSLVASSVSIGSLYLVPGFSSQIVNDGTVAVPSGAALTAGTVAVSAGALQEAGGALDIDGILTLGSLLISIRAPVVRLTSGVLDVLNHAHARLDGLNIMDGSVSLDATSTLEIGNAGNAAAGTITIDQGAALFTISPLRSIGTVSIAGPVLNNGTMSVLTASDLSDVMNNGSIEFDGTTFSDSVNDGSITADGGTLSTINGTGRIGVAGSVTIGQGVGNTVDLQAAGAELTVALGAGTPIDTSHTPPVSGFVSGNSIILQGVTADSVHYTPATTGIGTLTLDSAGSPVASLALLGTYAGDQFALSTDSRGSTVTLPCFAAGTRILTRRGEVKVEHLDVGDEVATLMGRDFRPVRWVGHRTVQIAGHPRAHEVLPVQIAANAFGAGRPRRPLLLSPDHAVFADGVLIPIKYLVNHSTIAQVKVRSISYWHVELDAHDVMLAEGLPAESYLDTGDRACFANGGVVAALHPSFASLAWEAGGCAPLVVTGCVVARVRRRLQRRASILRRQPVARDSSPGKSAAVPSR